MSPDFSIRSVPFSLRSDAGDGRTLAGYAAVFNSPATINEHGQRFTEVIAPGAFARAVQAKDRIRLQYGHGSHPVLGDLPIGKITRLEEDARGLYVEARLSDSWMVDPIRAAIADGAIDGMSFRFSVPPGGDTWDRSGDVPLRTIKQARVMELGPVAWPAYEETSVMVRSLSNLLDGDGIRTVIADLRSRQQVVSATGRSQAQRRALVASRGLEVA